MATSTLEKDEEIRILKHSYKTIYLISSYHLHCVRDCFKRNVVLHSTQLKISTDNSITNEQY